MPLFQINLDGNEINRKVFDLKELFYQWVVIEDYRRPTKTVQSQIACILAASLIFSGYYLVTTSLSCQICGKTPAKLSEY